jgi:hypothetical protein
MPQADAAYYRRRAREERERAKQATQADAAVIHEELAQHYEARAESQELTASVAGIPRSRPNGRPSA